MSYIVKRTYACVTSDLLNCDNLRVAIAPLSNELWKDILKLVNFIYHEYKAKV